MVMHVLVWSFKLLNGLLWSCRVLYGLKWSYAAMHNFCACFFYCVLIIIEQGYDTEHSRGGGAVVECGHGVVHSALLQTLRKFPSSKTRGKENSNW